MIPEYLLIRENENTTGETDLHAMVRKLIENKYIQEYFSRSEIPKKFRLLLQQHLRSLERPSAKSDFSLLLDMIRLGRNIWPDS